MQENKFREAASFYEAIVKKNYSHVSVLGFTFLGTNSNSWTTVHFRV
jgi:hypothetical protein